MGAESDRDGAGVVDGHVRPFGGQPSERGGELDGRRHVEVRRERVCVLPVLEEHEPQGLLNISVHGVEQATGLGS